MMRKMRKTFARVFLSVVVLLMLFSFAAFAETAVPAEQPAEQGAVTEPNAGVAAAPDTTVNETDVSDENAVANGAVVENPATDDVATNEETAPDSESEISPDTAVDNAGETDVDVETAPVVGETDANEQADISDEPVVEAVPEEETEEEPVSIFNETYWALLPPVIAIILALITKEVYSSLAIGILSGGVLYAVTDGGFAVERIIDSVLNKGLIASLADSYNAGILVFLVVLGIIVVLMNRAGGSRAYGEWASKKIAGRKGAALSTFVLGCLIFVDDYFNCLTVGSVMRPVTDKQKVSRAKLAYLIDATAAPVCIIAPISSWAAAVSGTVDNVNGIDLFVRTIPFNLYALLTLAMVIFVCVSGLDFGPMKKFEDHAKSTGDLFMTGESEYKNDDESVNSKGKVIDLVIPVVVLIIFCVLGMLYTGGIFEGVGLIDAFANCDASVGLALGSLVALVIIVVYMICRRVLVFNECMSSIPEGFKAMVPAILILTFAWTLKNITGLLSADTYVAALVDSVKALQILLPAILFLVAVGLSFATGTSWGTFGILIPIVTGVFNPTADNMSNLFIICIAACLAGAVCGDHCSPISDTTIMSSTGAQCKHVDHVSTQLPYAMLVAGVCLIGYLAAGFIPADSAWAYAVPVGALVLLIGILFLIKLLQKKKS